MYAPRKVSSTLQSKTSSIYLNNTALCTAPFYVGIARKISLYTYNVHCTLPTHAYILTFIINMAYKLSNISYLGSVHCHKTYSPHIAIVRIITENHKLCVFICL